MYAFAKTHAAHAWVASTIMFLSPHVIMCVFNLHPWYMMLSVPCCIPPLCTPSYPCLYGVLFFHTVPPHSAHTRTSAHPFPLHVLLLLLFIIMLNPAACCGHGLSIVQQ